MAGETTQPGAPSTSGGVTAPVRVALLYTKGTEALATAVGISGLATGDVEAQAKAIFNHVNAHGGLAGVKIAPFYYGINSADQANNPQQAQQVACAGLSQDLHVQFVVTYLPLFPATMECFSKAGISVLDDATGLPDSIQAHYAAHFEAPGDYALGRSLSVLVDGLWRTGWLTKSSKVGSLSYDSTSSLAAVRDYLVPALAGHGLTITSQQAISNSGSGVSESSAAVLKYRSSGVDRVIPVDANPLFVMEAASSQGYHPRYALTSYFGPGAFMETTAPKDQLVGAAGIGWQPYLDIGRGKKQGAYSANQTLCLSIMKAAGQSSSAGTTTGLQLQLCNVILYLKSASDKVGSAPRDLLIRARPLLGKSYEPADTFHSDVSARPDGADGYRDLLYVESCSCFQYVGAIKRSSG